MRILQLIDSLEAGGAERMAVTYANALVSEIAFSGLVTSRKEGPLLSQLHPNVAYQFLNKKNALDMSALWRLRAYVLKHQVTHVHAHSTSFFLAFMLKCLCPELKMIRHDHYGNAAFLVSRPYLVLKHTASFFNGVIAVNEKLREWSENQLKARNVIYLPNFSTLKAINDKHIRLKGGEGKRIVSLANLRAQKNHFLLLDVASKLKTSHPDWTFHLVGKDFEDDYSQVIKNKISALHLQNQVFLYGSQSNITGILEQSSIGVLTSISEGLPVAVLEYGMQQLPVVVTAVGALPQIIDHGKNGLIVPSNDVDAFYNALVQAIEDTSLREQIAKTFQHDIQQQYAATEIVSQYLKWVATL